MEEMAEGSSSNQSISQGSITMSESKPISPSDESVSLITEDTVPKKVTKRRTPRNKLLVKMKHAAETGDLQLVLNHYLSLCILSINDSKAFSDKMTPRTIIEVCEAITALKKLDAATNGNDADPEMKEFMAQLTKNSEKVKGR